MRRIIFHKHFEKSYSKLSKKTKEAFKDRRNLFLEDPQNPFLGIHMLHGEYKGYKSFNITGDIRVIYKEIKEEVYIFADIGSHGKLYS